MNVEAQSNQETIEQPSIKAVTDIIDKLPAEKDKEAGNIIDKDYKAFKEGVKKSTKEAKTNTENPHAESDKIQ